MPWTPILDVIETPMEASRDVPEALGRLRLALDDAFTRAGRDVGLTAQQAALLCAARQPAAVRDLAYALRCDRSNVSRLVQRAEARGLVLRQDGEEDGRLTIVELTADGERLARGFLAALSDQTERLRIGWSLRRQEQTVAVLNEVCDELDTPVHARRPRDPLRRPAHTRRTDRSPL